MQQLTRRAVLALLAGAPALKALPAAKANARVFDEETLRKAAGHTHYTGWTFAFSARVAAEVPTLVTLDPGIGDAYCVSWWLVPGPPEWITVRVPRHWVHSGLACRASLSITASSAVRVYDVSVPVRTPGVPLTSPFSSDLR